MITKNKFIFTILFLSMIQVTHAQDILKAFGCNEIQGYYYSRPLPEQEFIDFLQSSRSA